MNRLTETKRNFSGRMHQDDTSLLVSNHSPLKSSDANEANVRIFNDNTMNQLLVLQMCTQFKLCVNIHQHNFHGYISRKWSSAAYSLSHLLKQVNQSLLITGNLPPIRFQ